MNTRQNHPKALSPIKSVKAGVQHFHGRRWWGYGLLALLTGGPLYFLISVSTVEVGNQSVMGIGYSAAMSALLAGIGSMYVLKAALADIPPRYGYSRGSEERSCFATAALITLVLLVVRDYARAVFESTMPTWRTSIGSIDIAVPSISFVLLAITVLISPLVMMATMYNTSGYGVGDSFKQAFATGIAHYLPLLGLSVIPHIVLAIGWIIPLLGWIVAPAVIVLVLVDACREFGGASVVEHDGVLKGS